MIQDVVCVVYLSFLMVLILFKIADKPFSGQQISSFLFLKLVSFCPLLSFLFSLTFNSISKAKVLCPYQGLYQLQLAFHSQERTPGEESQSWLTPPPCPSTALVSPHHLLSALPGWALADGKPLCVLCPRRTCQLSGRSGKAFCLLPPLRKWATILYMQHESKI